MNRNLRLAGMALPILWAVLGSNGYAEVRKYDSNVNQSQLTLPRETISATTGSAQKAAQTGPSTSRSQPVTSDTTGVSAYVAQMQLLKPKEYKLGSARVFINANDLDPSLIEHIKELNALQDLHSEIYFQDVKPADLATLFNEKIKEYPKGVAFNVDLGGTLANELQVKGQNVLIYTDPKGKTAQYAIKSEYGFRAAIEKIKQGVAQ